MRKIEQRNGETVSGMLKREDLDSLLFHGHPVMEGEVTHDAEIIGRQKCSHNSIAGLEALDALVDAFAAEMKRKLRHKALEGRSGWDDPQNEQFIRDSMLRHVQRGRGQEVDVANLAAMLWNMGSNVELTGDGKLR